MKLYHISEDPNIKVFQPRPSPQAYEQLTGDVVFAVSDKLLHNYLLPRDCPRVTFYAGPNTSAGDKSAFLGESGAAYVVVVENGWLPVIQSAKIYCYEFPATPFTLLDENAGYYVAYEPVKPLAVTPINDIIQELQKRHVELRTLPDLWSLADSVAQSSLCFSLIRMRNARPKT